MKGFGGNQNHYSLLILFFVLLLFFPSIAFAWPTASQWIPVYKSGAILQDPNSDAQNARNVVSDATNAAAFMYNDGTYVYFRLRLDADPTGSGGQGLLQQFGWGVELDTNQNPANYEWLIIADGISRDETISLWQNTSQGTLGDPGDKPEILAASIPAAGNITISPADTSINGGRDYFLDWQFSYATFKQASGLTDSSPIRLFFGSSSSAQTLTQNGGDLVGGSDLYSGLTDYVLLVATTPTTGSVMFVADLAGNGDVTQASAGATLYIKVTDGDQNINSTTKQTMTVTLTTPGGDAETITLTETGMNTGIFTGSITTTSALPTQSNGSLQVMPGETVTVTYNDQIDASLKTNQQRTDALLISPPVIAATKTVNPASAVSGQTVTYTITITNSGAGDGWLSTIQDSLPDGFSYIPGSTAGFTTADPAIDGQKLTWSGNWIVPKKVVANGSVTLSFNAKAGGSAGTVTNTAVASGANISPVSTGAVAPVAVSSPQITLLKQVSATGYTPGSTLIYSVQYRNVGNAAAADLVFGDAIPNNTTYVAGSLRIGGAGSTYATAAAKTDAADGDEAEISDGYITFRIINVAADDGAVNSGPDEGFVYFKVIIN